MKKGDKIIMLFHCAGVTSEGECKIKKIRRNGNIIIENNPPYEFTPEGNCINDNTMFGACRTLKMNKPTKELDEQYTEPSEDDYYC
jgi:hypothetical protein